MVKYPRGFTNHGDHDPETRPPKLDVKNRVFNDFYPDKPRSAVMPPATFDTEEPRLSKRPSKGRR
jgi:hypothetical protein